MKTKFKIWFAFYIIFLFIGIFSCTDCDPFPDKSRVQNIQYHLYDFHNTNSIDLSEIQNGSVRYNELAIEIVPEVDNYFSILNKLSKFSFTQNAYACDPTPPVMVDQIENIEIYSDTSYNSNFPANNNLASIINVYLPEQNTTIGLTDFLEENPIFPRSIILTFNEAPNETKTHQLKIIITSNGELIHHDEYIFENVEIKTN